VASARDINLHKKADQWDGGTRCMNRSKAVCEEHGYHDPYQVIRIPESKNVEGP